jgi:hypothetical protein
VFITKAAPARPGEDFEADEDFGAEHNLSLRWNRSRGAEVPSAPVSPMCGLHSMRCEFLYSSDTVDRSPMIASPAGIPAARVTGVFQRRRSTDFCAPTTAWGLAGHAEEGLDAVVELELKRRG